MRAGDTSVAGPSDIQAAVTRAKHEGMTSILVGVRRDGHTLFIPIKIEK